MNNKTKTNKKITINKKVVLYQEYTNGSTEAIEAKYVFPLHDTAAVCGFEGIFLLVQLFMFSFFSPFFFILAFFF